jgi:hypothetical protein
MALADRVVGGSDGGFDGAQGWPAGLLAPRLLRVVSSWMVG